MTMTGGWAFVGSIALAGIVKRYADTVAVDIPDLVIDEGEFMVLLGPSGCGKTTTLRLIAGLEAPSSGEILMDGMVVNSLSPKERNVAMVFQDYALYPHMRVYDNIALNLRVDKIPKPEIDRRVRDVARLLSIEHLLERRPRAMSGGQQQRVALGRAIVRNPAYFLMDEPLSNLDAKLRLAMRSEIRRLHDRIGATTAYVTHDQDEAMALADRIVVMKDGRIRQVGTPRAIYDQPANEFVATFVGSPEMNLLEVAVSRTEDGFLFAHGELAFLTPWEEATWDNHIALPDRATLGVRPKYVRVRRGIHDPDGSGTISEFEKLGEADYVHLDVSGTILTARWDSDDEVRHGETVQFRIDRSGIRLFDVSNGERIPVAGKGAWQGEVGQG